MIKKNDNNMSCMDARSYYYDFSCGSRDVVPINVWEHINSCENCSRQVEQLKEALDIPQEADDNNKAVLDLLQLHMAYIGKEVTCKDAKSFIPSLLPPALQIRIPTPVTAHIDNCPQCSQDLDAIRNLDLRTGQLYHLGQILAADGVGIRELINDKTRQTISKMVQRPDSGIATVYETGEAAQEETAAGITRFYAPYNVRVTILNRKPVTEEKPLLLMNISDILKQKLSGAFVKGLVAVAAVLAISTILFLNMTPATAIDLKQVYKAVGSAKNAYIANFPAGKTEPNQERWLSTELGVCMFKQQDSVILCDINNKIKKTRKIGETAVLVEQISDAAVRTIVTNVFSDLLPFYNMTNIPKDAQWVKVQQQPASNIEIYDLRLTKNMGNIIVESRQRFFIDSRTALLKKIESYQTDTNFGNEKQINTVLFEYPQVQEVQKILYAF